MPPVAVSRRGVCHAHHHVAVGIVRRKSDFFNDGGITLRLLAFNGRNDFRISGIDLLRQSDLCFDAFHIAFHTAVNASLAVHGDGPRRHAGKETAFQLAGAAGAARHRARDLHRHDFALEQRDRGARIHIVDGMTQARESARGVVHKK